MKRVSAYVKGNRSTPEYYRIYQYLDRIDGIACTYHMMMPDKVYRHFMPISKQGIVKKMAAFLYIYFRMLTALVCDNLRRPDVIVVHKRIMPHAMPPSFRWLLCRMLRRGTRLVWDYDDQILMTHEISPRTFHEMSQWADRIVVTHQYLADMVEQPLRQKVDILPTTDGDMFFLSQDAAVRAFRLQTLPSEVRLLWLGTSLNLRFVEHVVPQLEEAACRLQADGRVLRLTIVCDAPLNVSTQCLHIDNVRWTRADAIVQTRRAHIGIMPLADNPFTRGKGGFKLVQYLSASLPCIASAVGFNKQILNDRCGCLLEEGESWADAVIRLADVAVWSAASRQAYQQWESDFSYERNLNYWRTLIYG